MSNLIKKQHYVPQHYLKEWGNKGLILTLLKKQNKINNLNIKDVCEKKYFYRLNNLSNEEICNLNNFTNTLFNDFGDLNFFIVYLIKLFILSTKDNELSINLLEKILSKIEYNGSKLVCCKSINDFKNIYDIDVLQYIIFQYCRTDKFNQNVKNDLFIDKEKQKMYLNVFPYIIFLISNRLTYNIFYYKHTMFTFLINDTNIPFITSDNPIININNSFYYPLSPKYALLMYTNENICDNKNDFLEEYVNLDFVNEYNNYIFDNSYKFVFSIDENILKKYIK